VVEGAEMIGNLTFLLSLTVAIVSQPSTLTKSKLPDCRRVIVEDPERRSFDDRNSFTLDIDGDGRPDTITPRTYTLKANRKDSRRLTPKVREIRWIDFDITTSKGRVLKSFFKYDYGTDEAEYWVYAFVPCSVNGDRRMALLFYSGDDTSVETIVLVNKGNVFRVHSRKVREVDF
jgi:hypothetical protein